MQGPQHRAENLRAPLSSVVPLYYDDVLFKNDIWILLCTMLHILWSTPLQSIALLCSVATVIELPRASSQCRYTTGLFGIIKLFCLKTEQRLSWCYWAWGVLHSFTNRLNKTESTIFLFWIYFVLQKNFMLGIYFISKCTITNEPHRTIKVWGCYFEVLLGTMAAWFSPVGLF